MPTLSVEEWLAFLVLLLNALLSFLAQRRSAETSRLVEQTSKKVDVLNGSLNQGLSASRAFRDER